MKPEEADILRDLWRFSVSERYTDKEIREALDKAIEALKERPHGEWIDTDVTYEDTGDVERRCSNCKHGDRQSPSAVVPYCWYCGASMRKEGDENER